MQPNSATDTDSDIEESVSSRPTPRTAPPPPAAKPRPSPSKALSLLDHLERQEEEAAMQVCACPTRGNREQAPTSTPGSRRPLLALIARMLFPAGECVQM